MTPDNAGQTVLEALDALLAKADQGNAPACTCSQYSAPHEPSCLRKQWADRQWEASAQLVRVRRVHLRPLVVALWATGHRPYSENTTHWHEAGETGYCPGCSALAALQRDIEEA